MPTPSFILPTSVPVVDASVEALRVYDGSPAGFDVLPMSFTRASTATRTDSAGNVVSAVPYNLVQYSEQFDNAAWNKGATSISANTTTAPNGTLTADSLIEDSTNALHQLLQTTSSVAGIYTASVYVKPNGRNWFSLNIAGAANYAAWFDVQNGVVGSLQSNITSATITGVGNGWFRCSVTANTGSLAPRVAINLATANNIFGYLGNGTDGVYIWGAQLVEGTQPLPYQETVTRLALPRLDYRNADGTLSSTPRLLLEPQRTNSIRNSTMVGAVAGTPGTLPTNYLQLGGGGLTRTVSLGVENGLQYVDLRYQGTATEAFIEWRLDTTTAIAALPSQVWSFTNYLKLVSGTMPNAFTLNVYARNAAAGVLQTWNTPASITSSLNRFQNIITATPANTAFIQNAMFLTITNGAAYDFTIRIAAPQMELGAYATTFIPTTTAAVTRLADTCSVTGASSIIGQTEGTLFVDVDNNESETAVFISLSNASASVNNHIWLGQVGTNIALFVRSGGTYSILASSITSVTGVKKIALAYGASFARIYVNGTQVFDSTAAVIPSGMDKIEVNNLNTSIDVGRVSLAQAALYTTRLSNSELQSLTTL